MSRIEFAQAELDRDAREEQLALIRLEREALGLPERRIAERRTVHQVLEEADRRHNLERRFA